MIKDNAYYIRDGIYPIKDRVNEIKDGVYAKKGSGHPVMDGLPSIKNSDYEIIALKIRNFPELNKYRRTDRQE